MKEWHVYLLKCADGSYYCGVTVDPLRRLRQHNGEIPGGARFTRARRPVVLLFERGGLEARAALRLEARIKRMPKQKKLAYLQEYS